MTVTVKPAMPVTLALYVAALLPTLVTRRVTVCVPARSPIAIDGDVQVARVERIAEACSALQVAGPTAVVVPHRNASQSLKPWL